jgi:hypothetical protein
VNVTLLFLGLEIATMDGWLINIDHGLDFIRVGPRLDCQVVVDKSGS